MKRIKTGEGFAYAYWLRHKLHYLKPEHWETNWQPWLWEWIWESGDR